MKKTLLLSVVASTMIMAGGDIAPVEPVVEAPVVVVVPTEAAKISGTAKLYYGTNDRSAANDLFSKSGAFGDVYADLKYSRKVMENVTVNAGIAGISTLGLETDVVSSTWAIHGPSVVDDVVWINEANVVIDLPYNTFTKIGRQELDTPYFYSENWSIATNTFDAAVVGNTSLPDTTLIAAWVGRGNGATSNAGSVDLQDENFQGGHTSFGGNPAYAFGAINKSLDNTTLQGWYYKVPSTFQAAWLQGDTNIAGFDLGAQYAYFDNYGPNTGDVWAVKAGYGMDEWNIYGAYSQTDDNVGAGANLATGGQSRLYTEAYWNYGFVSAADATSFAIGGNYDFGIAKIGAQYTNVDNGAPANAGDLEEYAVTTSAKLGPVNADLAYVYAKKGAAMNGANTVLIMLNLPYSL